MIYFTSDAKRDIPKVTLHTNNVDDSIIVSGRDVGLQTYQTDNNVT